MNQSKTILISTVAASLVLLAGCTTVPTATNTNTVSNTNATVNTNTTNDNTNIAVVTNSNGNTNGVVVNENTNSDQGSEVDTTDWLTYTNDEYGFSFRYPKDWEVKDLDQTTIGLISPELKVELAKGPNSIISSDLMFSINQPITKATYITGGFVDSLNTAKLNGDIRELNFNADSSRAKFIEHNDFADVDQYSQYIKVSESTIISSTYSMNLDKTLIFENILDSLRSQ